MTVLFCDQYCLAIARFKHEGSSFFQTWSSRNPSEALCVTIECKAAILLTSNSGFSPPHRHRAAKRAKRGKKNQVTSVGITSLVFVYIFSAQSICKTMSMKAMRTGRLGAALAWCLRSKVRHFIHISFIAEDTNLSNRSEPTSLSTKMFSFENAHFLLCFRRRPHNRKR